MLGRRPSHGQMLAHFQTAGRTGVPGGQWGVLPGNRPEKRSLAYKVRNYI